MILEDKRLSSRLSTPSIVGSSPRRNMGTRILGPLMALAIATGVGACANTEDNQVQTPVVLGMNDTMPPFYDDGMTTIYEAQLPVNLPMRQPTATELSGLQSNVAPYPHQPFLLASDVRIEVRYTITN